MRHFEQRDFGDVVVSAKAHDVQATIATYRAPAQEIPHGAAAYRHWELKQARSCRVFQIGLRSVFFRNEGIGDTMRISLTDEPTGRGRVLDAARRARSARRGPEIISCPNVAAAR